MKRYYFSDTQKIALLSVLSALLLGVPFLKYEYGFVVIFGISAYIGLLYVLSQQKKFSVFKKIILAWLPGFASLLIVVAWLLLADKSQWSQLTMTWRWGLSIFSYIGFAAILSTQYVVIATCLFGLKVNIRKPIIFLLLPSFWVVGEFFRSVLFSILLMGPGGSIGPFWNFGALGLAASTTLLGFLARFVGLWGLSFAVVLIALSITWLFWRMWKLPLVTLSVIVAMSVLGCMIWLPVSSGLRVGVLQYLFPPGPEIDKVVWTNDIGKAADTSSKSSVVVLPEYSGIFGESNLSREQKEKILNSTTSDGGIVVTSENTGTNSRVNTLLIGDKKGEVLESYQKTFLIPTGEYVPYLFQFILSTANKKAALEHQQETYTVHKGDKPNRLFEISSTKIAAQVCSGAIAPELFRQQVRAGGQILTNSAAIAILAPATTYHEQAKQTARFMAIANARPFAQGSMGTYSYIINSNGEFIEQSNKLEFSYKSALVTVPNRRTIYTILGEWFVVLSLGTILTYAASYFKHKKFDK